MAKMQIGSRADYDVLRERLADARNRAGLTQAEVARRLGVPQSFVSKYETGERRLDVVEFLGIARVLGLDAAQLVGQLRRKLSA